jgi:hypothetical protein
MAMALQRIRTYDRVLALLPPLNDEFDIGAGHAAVAVKNTLQCAVRHMFNRRVGWVPDDSWGKYSSPERNATYFHTPGEGIELPMKGYVSNWEELDAYNFYWVQSFQARANGFEQEEGHGYGYPGFNPVPNIATAKMGGHKKCKHPSRIYDTDKWVFCLHTFLADRFFPSGMSLLEASLTHWMTEVTTGESYRFGPGKQRVDPTSEKHAPTVCTDITIKIEPEEQGTERSWVDGWLYDVHLAAVYRKLPHRLSIGFFLRIREISTRSPHQNSQSSGSYP